MKISGAMVEALVKLLQSIGLLTDPSEEVDFRKALADLEKTRAQVWVDFVRATTPDAARVYIWTNSLIALVRPALSMLIVCGMIFAPSRILELVRTFGDAGATGWIIMAPVLWWFFGRDVSKVLAMRYGGLIPVGSGAAEPAPGRADGSGDAGAPWRRLERLEEPEHLEEVDGQGESMEQLEPEFDRPVQR